MKTMKKNCSPLRMNEWHVDPRHYADGTALVQPAPSPFSLRGMANAVGGAADSVMSRFRPPAGYTPAVQQQQLAPAPAMAAPVIPAAAAPALPQLGGMNLGVLQQREAAAGLRDGSPFVTGPGGPTDDKVPAMLSPGESVLPADTTAKVGPHNIKALIDATHTPASPRGVRHFADGTDEVTPFEQGPSVRTTVPRIAPIALDSAAGDGRGTVNPPLAQPQPMAPLPGAGTAPTGAFADTRSVLRGAGQDISDAVNRGAYGEAAGQALRGGLALFPAVANDVLAPRQITDKVRAALPDLPTPSGSGVADQVFDAASTFATGRPNNLPSVPALPTAGAGTSSLRAGFNPTDQRLAGGLQALPVDNGREVPGATGVRRMGNSYTDGSSGTGVGITPNPQEGLQRQARANEIYRSINTVRPEEQLTVLNNGSDLEARNAGVKSTLGGVGRLQTAARAQDIAEENNRAQHGIALRGQDVQAATARASNAATLRGQDLTYDSTTRGQDMTARTAANVARIDQMNKDRQFKLDESKFGADQAKAKFEMREKGLKDLTDQLHGTIGPIMGQDGKPLPDDVAKARYATQIQTHLGTMESDLSAKAQAGDQHAAAALEDLRSNGAAAMPPAMRQQLLAGIKADALANQTASGRLNPFGSSRVVSDAPIKGLRKTSDGIFGIGGEYTSDRGDRIPAREIDSDGSYLFGPRRTTYDSLKK